MNDASGEVRRLYRLSLLAVMMLGILVSIAWAWFAFNPVPLGRAQMVIEDVSYGDATLCPGEALAYTYTVDIKTPGVYIFDSTTWRLEPTQIIEWSPNLRLVSEHAQHVTVYREWTLPQTWYNTLLDRQDAWTPGDYERQIAITSSGRDTLPSISLIPFTIREDCE